MEGKGGYNRNSRVQAAGLASAIPLFTEAARAVSLPPAPEPIVIADFGASEGRNSLVPVAKAIFCIRSRVGPARAISVIHTDLPNSDFSGLFATLQNDPESYLRHDPAIFASAVGRTFYEQLLPSGTVTLGWSSWAVQWLSRIPAIIPDHVQVAYSRNRDAQAAYAAQAAEDWRAFLTHRGQELRSGARLVVLTMASTDAGDFGYQAVLEALMESLAQLVTDGLISAEEVARMSIPTVGRTRAALLQPFADSSSFAGLAIESADVFLGRDRIWEEYEQSGDARAFGGTWAAFVRASTFPTLALGLGGGSKDPRVSRFYQDLELGLGSRLARSPERTVIPLAKLVLVKSDL